MPFHAVVVFTLGYDFLFKSILGHCGVASQIRGKNKTEKIKKL